VVPRGVAQAEGHRLVDAALGPESRLDGADPAQQHLRPDDPGDEGGPFRVGPRVELGLPGASQPAGPGALGAGQGDAIGPQAVGEPGMT
jgi:hypothetical protein